MQRVDGVALDAADAAELVAALDMLAQLAAHRGARLSPRVAGLRDGLAGHLAEGAGRARVIAPDTASTRVDSIASALTRDQGAIDTATAARRLGLTADGVRWLCRTGRLPAYRSAGRWWLDAAEVDALAALRHMT